MFLKPSYTRKPILDDDYYRFLALTLNDSFQADIKKLQAEFADFLCMDIPSKIYMSEVDIFKFWDVLEDKIKQVKKNQDFEGYEKWYLGTRLQNLVKKYYRKRYTYLVKRYVEDYFFNNKIDGRRYTYAVNLVHKHLDSDARFLVQIYPWTTQEDIQRAWKDILNFRKKYLGNVHKAKNTEKSRFKINLKIYKLYLKAERHFGSKYKAISAMTSVVDNSVYRQELASILKGEEIEKLTLEQIIHTYGELLTGIVLE